MFAYRRADYATAIELLSSAAEYDPTLTEPWMIEFARRRAAASSAYLAMALFRVGRVTEAEAMLQQAQQLLAEHNADRFGAELLAEIAIQEAATLIRP